MEETPKSTKPLGKIILAAVAVVIIGLLVTIVILLMRGNESPTTQPGSGNNDPLAITQDPNTVVGGLDGRNLEEMLAEMQAQVDDGNIMVSFGGDMDFPDGSSNGAVQIENPVENKYPMIFTITLQDTNEEIYRSGLVPVGSHLNEIKLNRDLDKGEYLAALTYHAYNEEKKEAVGTTSVEVLLKIAA